VAEKEMCKPNTTAMRDLDQRARDADARNKIWQYRTRRIVLFFLISGGILTILDKCPSIFRTTHANVVAPVSSDSAKQEKNQGKAQNASLSHKSHRRKPDVETPARDENVQGSIKMSDNTAMPAVVRPKPKLPYPVQVTNSDDIEFKLLNAEGSSRAQTIKMTMVLTTSDANRYIWSAVNSIIDPEGNEYKLKSFTNGASAYDTHIALNTGVPIKLTYTFGGVLPNVKYIKLFKFEYRHKSLDDNIPIEFRDVFVDWR